MSTRRPPAPRGRRLGWLVALLLLVLAALGVSLPEAALAPGPSPTAVASPRQAAPVVAIVDGDTIRVRLAGATVSVRYIGIDTPETVDPRRPVERFGREAAEANRRLVEGKTVYLERDVSETDAFGRLLRYVYVDAGAELVLVNAELVRLGYARVATYPPDVRDVELLLRLEGEARAAGRGLWASAP